MAYDRINWENTPSHVTPLSAENLNTMDEAIDSIDEELNRVGVKAVNLEARMNTAEGNITDITEELTEQDTYAKGMGTKTLQHETDIATLQGQVTTIISGATPAGNEVTDIRTAENGTTYDTAGNAVRAQVRQMVMVQNTQPDSTNYPGNKLWINDGSYDAEDHKVPTWEEFSELKADLSEDVTTTTNLTSSLQYPYKIANNYSVGTVVSLTPTSESATACIGYECKKGDVFTLTGLGYSSIRLWAFLDSEQKLLSKADANENATGLELTAEQDGYFIVNVNTNRPRSLSVTRTTTEVKGMSEVNGEIDNVKNDVDALFPKSRFYKGVSWGSSDLGKYIHVTHGDFDLFTSQTTAAQYYQLWSELAEASDGYITETELGLASDNTTTMYSYVLKPIAGYIGPKLFIVCGQHGFEKAGPFGLYYFVRELVNNYRSNPSLMYLRNWCELVIIPLMNPYGFNNNSYTNANGVNLNRNWPTAEWSQGTQGTTNYGGSSAGSEVETQYAVTLFTTHSDSLIFTDIHTNGQTAVSSYASVMWQAFESEINEDSYSALCVEAAKKEINDLSSAFCVDYPEDCPTYTQCGHYTLDTATGGLATIYAREHDMLAETVEGFPAWPEGLTYTPSCHQANADIFGNWFRCVLSVYERLGSNKYPTE